MTAKTQTRMTATHDKEIFSDIDIKAEIADYYKTYFNIDLSEENLAQILCTEMNKNSAS